MPQRKLIVQEFVSVDGLAAGPNDDVRFVPASMQGDQRFGQEQVSFVNECDTMVLGRVTYEMFKGYWPSVVKEGDEKIFADKFNGLSKIVFSTTLDRAPWGAWPEARVVRRSPSEEVAELKQRPGKDIFVSGSLSIVEALLSADLIDEFRLVVCPVVLDRGKKLFDHAPGAQLTLLDLDRMDRGGVLLRYGIHVTRYLGGGRIAAASA